MPPNACPQNLVIIASYTANLTALISSKVGPGPSWCLLLVTGCKPAPIQLPTGLVHQAHGRAGTAAGACLLLVLVPEAQDHALCAGDHDRHHIHLRAPRHPGGGTR